MVSGLTINVFFKRSDIGITIYRYPTVEFVDFLVKFMNDFPSTIVLIGFFLWIIEWAKNNIQGIGSGRLKLVKMKIEEERAKRNRRARNFSENATTFIQERLN